MFKSWKTWVLITLLAGPYAVYIGLGFLWLIQHGWWVATAAGFVGFGSGVLFYLLAAKWTKQNIEVLPPIDWESPGSFAPIDREAWALVEHESQEAESVSIEAMSKANFYLDSGRKLAEQLAKHYHPETADAIEGVPIIELLTALELAAEDLNSLVRQVPGGDLITTGHWKSAVQAAGWISKANKVYSFLLPAINPMTGFSRLASQHLMVKPAWRNVQDNLLRWFYQAYVNRLGIHLIELYSGRLVIGAEQYRKIIRKPGDPKNETVEQIDVAVVGARGSGHDDFASKLRENLLHAPDEIRTRLKTAGLSNTSTEIVLKSSWHDIVGYSESNEGLTPREKASLDASVVLATDSDLLVCLIDDRLGTLSMDIMFLNEWSQWFEAHPTRERPPVIVLATTTDDSRLDTIKAVLPATVDQIVQLDLSLTDPLDRFDVLLRVLEGAIPQAERAVLLRQMSVISNRSKSGRLFKQIGESGKWLWNSVKNRKGGGSK
jgi:hypothetical protein